MGTWLSRSLSLKGRAECAVYVFSLILYRLVVLPLPKARRLALQQSLSRLLWAGGRPMVRRQVCIKRTRYRGLGMSYLVSHWLAERLAYLGRSLKGVQCGDERQVGLFLASSQTQEQHDRSHPPSPTKFQGLVPSF